MRSKMDTPWLAKSEPKTLADFDELKARQLVVQYLYYCANLKFFFCDEPRRHPASIRWLAFRRLSIRCCTNAYKRTTRNNVNAATERNLYTNGGHQRTTNDATAPQTGHPPAPATRAKTIKPTPRTDRASQQSTRSKMATLQWTQRCEIYITTMLINFAHQ